MLYVQIVHLGDCIFSCCASSFAFSSDGGVADFFLSCSSAGTERSEDRKLDSALVRTTCHIPDFCNIFLSSRSFLSGLTLIFCSNPSAIGERFLASSAAMAPRLNIPLLGEFGGPPGPTTINIGKL